MSTEHDQAVQASFTHQAAAFENDRFIGQLVTQAEWILQRLELSVDQLALDVAAGTGHAARGLASRVGSVVAVDATRAMLAAGQDAAQAAGVRNVVFLEGDATALPFLEASFDVVVCRFAAHHFQEPDRVFAEMLRCARPGGQILVADLVVDDDPAVAAAQNRLELQRDPSHARCLTAAELQRRLAALGVSEATVDFHETVRPLAPWLTQTACTQATTEAIARALHEEIAGGPLTGLRPRLQDGELWFEQRFAAVTGRAPH